METLTKQTDVLKEEQTHSESQTCTTKEIKIPIASTKQNPTEAKAEKLVVEQVQTTTEDKTPVPEESLSKVEPKTDVSKDFDDELCKKGLFPLSRTLAMGLSFPAEIIFSRLRMEQKHAIEKNYVSSEGYFFIDVDEIQYHTGFSKVLIENIILNLYDRKLIDGTRIDDKDAIRINQKNTIQFVHLLESNDENYDIYEKLSGIQKAILSVDSKGGLK